MTVCLLVMTDGRATVHEAIASGDEALVGMVTEKVIHDDSGDESHRQYLAERFPDFDVIGGDRAGFGGAIRRAWAHVAGLPVEWVFHLEDDFTFRRPVDLAGMADVLGAHPHLVQMALRRQAWNPDEIAAGGIVEQHSGDYTDRTDGTHQWLEHRRFFTTNPSLYRRTLCGRHWPDGAHSEGRFSIALFDEDRRNASAFWGARASGEWVQHIGRERVGTGY